MIPDVTILGRSEFVISSVCDNFESHGKFPRIIIINNLRLEDKIPYKNPKFNFIELYELEDNAENFLIGVPSPQNKITVFNLFNIKPEKFINSIHNSSQISSTTKLGSGIIINSLVSIASHSTIGDFVTINRNASVGHHTTIENYVTISPSAVICGRVNIGYGSYIGAGAIIRDGISVGENCIIGAGSVVVKDVESGSTGYGNPFKISITSTM